VDQTRQYGSIDKIRPDHVNRYRFAAEMLRDQKVLDLACGCGYGAWILHQAGNDVTGVDIEPEAIAYARRFYQGPTYLCQSGEETEGEFDALVSFETLEHLARPEVVLSIKAPVVIASVPNEEQYPFIAERFAGDAYPHLRHYTPSEFQGLLNAYGFEVTEWFCQKDKQTGAIVPGTDGMFLIAIGQRLP
jgi:SAM-dependent methyltransferase